MYEWNLCFLVGIKTWFIVFAASSLITTPNKHHSGPCTNEISAFWWELRPDSSFFQPATWSLHRIRYRRSHKTDYQNRLPQKLYISNTKFNLYSLSSYEERRAWGIEGSREARIFSSQIVFISDTCWKEAICYSFTNYGLFPCTDRHCLSCHCRIRHRSETWNHLWTRSYWFTSHSFFRLIIMDWVYWISTPR